MRLGRIFRDITGKNTSEFQSTSEIWEAVKSARPTKTFNEARYGNDVVKCTGGVFGLHYYDENVDEMIINLQ